MADFADTRASRSGSGTVRGVAVSAASGNACLVMVGGITVTARVATTLTIAVGNILLLARLGSTYYVTAIVPPAPPATPAAPAPSDSTPTDTGDKATTKASGIISADNAAQSPDTSTSAQQRQGTHFAGCPPAFRAAQGEGAVSPRRWAPAAGVAHRTTVAAVVDARGLPRRTRFRHAG